MIVLPITMSLSVCIYIYFACTNIYSLYVHTGLYAELHAPHYSFPFMTRKSLAAHIISNCLMTQELGFLTEHCKNTRQGSLI